MLLTESQYKKLYLLQYSQDNKQYSHAVWHKNAGQKSSPAQANTHQPPGGCLFFTSSPPALPVLPPGSYWALIEAL
jgi:hypothetical protein